MKTYFKILITVIALSISTSMIQAQTKLTEGSVVFSITMTDNDLDPQIASMMPKEMTLTFKGDKSKTDMKMGMGTIIVLYDDKAKFATTLMDMMGQKTAIKISEADMEKEKGKQPKTTVKNLEETKVICGYTCHKAELTIEGEKEKQIVYYTKDIVAKNSQAQKGGLKGLDGFPMEYVISMQGMGMKMTAKTVSKDKLEDAVFKIPEGYKEMTMDEAKKMGGH